MSKENRKNIPEEKKEARNRYDTSADNILEETPEGKHFNENLEPRRPDPDAGESPNAHLGAEEISTEQSTEGIGNRDTTPITAPEIREDMSKAEEETLEEIKKDMTGG